MTGLGKSFSLFLPPASRANINPLPHLEWGVNINHASWGLRQSVGQMLELYLSILKNVFVGNVIV